MTIGERIKKRRQELGMTQGELAEKLGNGSRASVCTVEKDREDLTLDRVRRYADALNVEPGYLAGWLTLEESDAIRLYKQYQESDPQIQAAVETLLAPRKQTP